jgi:hypothetical protein
VQDVERLGAGAAPLHDAVKLQRGDFLAPPRSFPVASAPFDTYLSVGGVTLRVASDDARLASRPTGALAPFSSDDGVADVDIRARWTDEPPESRGTLRFDSGGAWQLHESDGDFVFTIRSSIGGPNPYKIARFDRRMTVGDVQLHRSYFEQHPSARAHPLQYPLDELVMIHVLSQGKGVEVHGCGLLDSAGRAYVFVGQSGAGKSTFARLWADRPGITLLSDERVVLRTDGERIGVHGTPWQGDAHFASPRAGDLAALFFLNKAASHAVVPAHGSRAAARLFACSFLPFHDPQAVDRTMTAVEQVIDTTPCYDLFFAPDASVVDVLTTHARIG